MSAAAAFDAVDDRAWQADIDLKVMAAIRLCRLVILHMKRRSGGRIINVTTVGGKAPGSRSLPITVTRAAGINLNQGAGQRVPPDGSW
jgi:3-oxoacyl-[acyl-carrier protein] reductase